MKVSLTRDTLAYQQGIRPALQFRDMSKAPLQAVVKACNEYIKLPNIYDWLEVTGPEALVLPQEDPKGDPERDAIIFYLLQHAMALIRHRVHPLQPLGEYLPIVELYHREVAVRATRMFFYLLLIVTREARHVPNINGSAALNLGKKWGQDVWNFHTQLTPHGESAAVQWLRDHPPAVLLGNYTGYMAEHFYKCGYGGSMGGPNWGVIGDLLHQFVTGKITGDFMLDKSFALAHNTGPIFNKGVLYHYEVSELMKILDVQRAGQIPQLVAKAEVSKAKHPLVQQLWNTLYTTFPEEFGGYVDWYQVEALNGTKGSKYPHEKKQQASTYGVPGTVKAKVEAQQAKQAVQQAEQEQEQLALVEICPGEFIKKIPRPQGD